MASRFDKFFGTRSQSSHLSSDEAQRLNHSYIGTEHILLGLVKEEDGVAAKVLVGMVSIWGNITGG
jgi:ATP-dependent Clp protease ATP-binding subunit ClpC